MKRRFSTSGRAAGLALALLCAGCAGRARTPFLPRPTENLLAEDAEAEQREKRLAWIEEMHRTAPDVDWRAIERANGEREQLRRNRLAALPDDGPGSWTEVGSQNQAGRMHCATLSSDGTQLYAGSSLGSVWRGNLDGTGWTPLGDNLYGGAHEVVVLPGELPGDPDVIVTAEDGGKVRVSRDLGATWEAPAGTAGLLGVRGLAALQDASRTIALLVRRSSPWDTPALLVSTDYGRNFTQTWGVSTQGYASMWVPRVGSEAATHIYISHKGKLRLSTDAGQTVPPAMTTIDTSADRAVLTGSEAGAPTLYLALRSGGVWTLYWSGDGGVSFTPRHTITDFWETMCASILQPDTVMYGGTEVWRSTDGASNFSHINGWGEYYGDPLHKLHADTPGLYCVPDPLDSLKEIWYGCTDGGLYESRNSGGSVTNLSLEGLGVSQYYSTHTAVDDTTLIVAGAQDQGYQQGVLQTPSGPGPSTPFDQLISGDYGHITSGDGTHKWLYSTYPGFILVHKNPYNVQLGTLSFPAGASNLWLPPVVADPLANTTFYFCGDLLTRYDRTVNLNFQETQHSTQNFAVGGGNYLSMMAFAPSDPQRAYAVNDAGQIFVSTDHAVTWQNTTRSAPGEHYFYGNTIAVHPTNRDEVAIGGSGYSNDGVIRSVDGGQTWFGESDGLPSTLVYGLTYAPDGSGDLYAATEAGAWRWDAFSDQWSNIMGNDAPLTTYWSVEAVQPDIVRFATYGRGIWDYAIPLGASTSYCVAKENSQACTPQMTFSGTPSVTGANSYVLGAIAVLNNKNGLLYYGYAPASAPFQGGTKCVAAPTKRTPLQGSAGNPPPDDCSGSYAYDFNARIQSGADPALIAGAVVYAQYWSRDPLAVAGTGLTDAVSFTIQP